MGCHGLHYGHEDGLSCVTQRAFYAVGMVAQALSGTFSCLRIRIQDWELMDSIGKTLMQSGGTFGPFVTTGMGIRC